jgi:phage terminase Nu1 subunit (DNA packaging protein)
MLVSPFAGGYISLMVYFLTPVPNDRGTDAACPSAQLRQRAAHVRWLAESIPDELASEQLADFAEELEARAETQRLTDAS